MTSACKQFLYQRAWNYTFLKISSLKIDMSMSLIGVIMGEFLSCKKGIGYLILYGTQVFNLSLVMCGILILSLLSFLLNILINLLEKRLS